MNERDFMDAVGRIHADEGLKTRVMALRDAAPRRKPVLKYAVSVALAAAVVCGLGFWPQGTVEQNAGAEGGSPKGFAIMVNAAEKDGGETALAPGRTFMLRSEGDQHSGGRGGWNKETGEYEYMSIYEFPLVCVGDGLRKVTYETDRGVFEEKVEVTQEQAEDEQSLIRQGYENLFRKKDDRESGRTLYYAYRPLGAAVTQDVSSKDAGLLLLKVEASSEKDLRPTEENHFLIQDCIGEAMTGTRITVTATFGDGSSLTKTIELSGGEHGFRVGVTLIG